MKVEFDLTKNQIESLVNVCRHIKSEIYWHNKAIHIFGEGLASTPAILRDDLGKCIAYSPFWDEIIRQTRKMRKNNARKK